MRRTITSAGFAIVVLLICAFGGDYTVTVLDYIGLSSLVTFGLVVLTGIAGQTSFGQAAFVGIGAYATAVLTTRYGLDPWFGLAAALLLSGAGAWLIGWATLRLSGHYLPLSTIAWGISLFFLFGNLDFLGGHSGIDRIPAISIFGLSLDNARGSAMLIWSCVILAAVGIANLSRSRQGRALQALRVSPLMAETFGIDTAAMKMKALILSALLAGLSGWLYAHLLRFVNPTPFSLAAGIEYLFMAVIGGVNIVCGAVAGAAFVKLLQDWLQDWLPALVGQSGNYDAIFFGALVVLLLHVAPDGLAGALMRWRMRRRRQSLKVPQPDTSPRRLPQRAQPVATTKILRVEALRKTFQGLVAVDDVTFDVDAGAIVGLIGPNGAGKSTLFNLLSGALQRSAGVIEFLGTSIGGMSARKIAAFGIARTFQHAVLLPDVSVLENAMIGAHRRTSAGMVAACLGFDHAEERTARAEAMRQIIRVGLADCCDQLAGSLPLGKQRSLEIARALCADPILLLLDEPAAGLRLREKRDLHRLLRQLRTEGLTILIVEHDMDFVMSLVDKLVAVNFGQKISEGSPLHVQTDPKVQEAYLGTAA